ncbi:hypothetical protein PsYK624_126320 [Phanerochaete sordida]|uniref:Uncharacterized protein n=1 Tax=Phanerochaete sordida TaxID=48140 RepID=A0A9P3GN07_9APHY|nr:hypothetical protein PsYK624_126320 [Phanerochaete sordida]
MSTPASTLGPAGTPLPAGNPPPPPPGLNYIIAIKSSLVPAATSFVFAGMFVPLIITLFLLSTPRLRRQPIFILNVLSLLFGLTMSSLSISTNIAAMLLSFDASTIIVPTAILTGISPVLVGSVLFVRIFAVYPWSRISNLTKVLAYGVPIVLRVARTVNITLNLGLIYRGGGSDRSSSLGVIGASANDWQRSSTKVECTLQLIDNTYVSALFLWKLRQAAKLSASIRLKSSNSYARRIRSLMWIAVSNFVIPDILSLVQLIVLFLHPDDGEVALYVFVIFFANPCVEIIGVLFATVWAASNHWQADHGSAVPTAMPTISIDLGSHVADAPGQAYTAHSLMFRAPSVDSPSSSKSEMTGEKVIQMDATFARIPV